MLRHAPTPNRIPSRKPHGQKWPRALLLPLVLVVAYLPFLWMTCAAHAQPSGISGELAHAAELDAALDSTARRLYRAWDEGRLDAAGYTYLMRLHAECRESATRWLVAGREEWEARAAFAILIRALPGEGTR